MLKRAALLLACASLALWIGCSTTTNIYVYAAIPGSSQIFAFREDPNSGFLSPVEGGPFVAGSAVQSLAIHPSKKFLYAANAGSSDISEFAISGGGILTEVTPRQPAGTVPILLAMDPAGAFLYVANAGSNNISSFSIDPSTGKLSQLPGSPFSVGLSPLNMKLAPSGNVLYVTGSSGAGLPGYVQAFTLNAGVVSNVPVPGSPYQVGMIPQGLAINPAGTFLYAGNAAPDNSISIFAINSDGSLAEVSGSPIGESYTGPIALLVDNSGKYLYVANVGSNLLAGFSIGSDGGLSLLSSSPFATSAQPSFIASDPAGHYLFVGNQSGTKVQSFGLDTGSGTLTSIASYSVPGTASSIAVTP